MIIKDTLTIEINCPKAKSKGAVRGIDAHWYAWNYVALPDEDLIVFFDVEPEAEAMLEDYENVLMNGRWGFKDLNDLKDAIKPVGLIEKEPSEFYKKYNPEAMLFGTVWEEK